MSGGNYDGVTPQYDSQTTRVDKDGREVEAFRVTVRDTSVRSAQGAAPAFGPNDTPANILGPIERDITTKREMLNRHEGFDARTGAPNWTIQGDRRAVIERELLHLERFTLPLAREQARQAAEWHAAQPTREDRIRAEHDRRQAIFAKAEDIADQLEAEKQAERIIKARGLGI